MEERQRQEEQEQRLAAKQAGPEEQSAYSMISRQARAAGAQVEAVRQLVKVERCECVSGLDSGCGVAVQACVVCMRVNEWCAVGFCLRVSGCVTAVCNNRGRRGSCWFVCWPLVGCRLCVFVIFMVFESMSMDRLLHNVYRFP